MAVSVRLDFTFAPGEGERATVADLRKWLQLIDSHGVPDEEELVLETDSRDEVEGFYVWAFPE